MAHILVFLFGVALVRGLACPPRFTARERRAVTLGVMVAAPVAGSWWWLVPALAAASVVVVWWGQTR